MTRRATAHVAGDARTRRDRRRKSARAGPGHAALGKKLGISRSTITALADGRRTPSLAHARVLFERAGIHPRAGAAEARGVVDLTRAGHELTKQQPSVSWR